jgi:hypothetical protein
MKSPWVVRARSVLALLPALAVVLATLRRVRRRGGPGALPVPSDRPRVTVPFVPVERHAFRHSRDPP